MSRRILIALCLFAAMPTMLLPARAAAETATPSPGAENLPRLVKRYGFAVLDKQPAMRIRSNEGPPGITFGLRADEAAQSLQLRFRYTYSPTLTPLQSHVRVLLNDEIVGLLPVKREQAGRSITREIDVDPALVSRVNRLSLEFIAHYTAECEDPLHLNMWLDIERGTEVVLTTRKKKLSSDLALLPQPFFDTQDYSRLELPFVFSSSPSYATLSAAGTAASWFGKLAAWRGARFPASLGAVPAGHALVFATNSERPALLKDMPPFDGPAIGVMTNPVDGFSKLLLVTGRNGEDLRTAAATLALGHSAMSGTQVAIKASRLEAARRAYDAPNWVRVDRPMKFGELIESPQQLQVFGHVPAPVKIDLRIPPDLFTWRSRGVPVDLKFRYTPPVRTADSLLTMNINGEQVQSVNLRSSGQGGESARVVLPLLDSGLLGDGNELLIPAFKLGARNQLAYEFTFSYLRADPCLDTQIENIVAMIDPDSKVDFSGYPHYAEMPHLGYFASSGFPFTKYADLSQTAVVLPRTPRPDDIEVMLALLARASESTGYPATRVTVVGPDDQTSLQDKDLLLIGSVTDQPLLDAWNGKLPAVLTGLRRGIRSQPGTWDSLFEMLGIDTDMQVDDVEQKHIRGNGPLAAMLGFQSPLTKGRSVVAVTAVERGQMQSVLDVLQDNVAVKHMHGSIALVHGGQVESLMAGKTYQLGSVKLWTRVWFPLSGHPVLLAIMSVLAVLIFAFALWRTLRAVAKNRLQEPGS